MFIKVVLNFRFDSDYNLNDVVTTLFHYNCIKLKNIDVVAVV